MSDRHTPTLSVCDARGLAIRAVEYLAALPVVQRAGFDALGHAVQAWDARKVQDGRAASLQLHLDLLGRTLRRTSDDAGLQVELIDGTGQVLQRWDGRGNQWRFGYDALARQSSVHEQAQGEPSRCQQRWYYGAADGEPGRNQRGRLTRQDDPAGLCQWSAFSLLGEAHSETRQFLKGLDAPDWPASEADLEPTVHRTLSYFAASGQALAHCDAAGNRTEWRHAVDGLLRDVRLTLHGGSAQTVATDLVHDAAGRRTAATAGNGIRTLVDYSPADGRRWRQRTLRGGGECLQELLCDYDPVGNPVRLEDRAQPVRFLRNQRIEPVCSFAYDSLGQLIEARGWESDQARVGPGMPALEAIGDSNRQRNYVQHFSYDLAGNLLELRHQAGDSGYRRRMKVATQSNRSLYWADDDDPDLGAGFDASGNQLLLESGCQLQWNARNELARAVTVVRADAANDEEQYQYAGGGQRVRKLRSSRASGREHMAEVRYLPGLELRSDTATGERLQVIAVVLGEGSLNVLHWEGAPPAGLANDAMRYACTDPLGSHVLEFDGQGALVTQEHYHPFGGTAWWAGRNALEAGYKTRRYCGKERDVTGLYYYGLRYYAPWQQRWISADPSGAVDGLNLYRAMRNSPLRFIDPDGGQSFEWIDVVAVIGLLLGLFLLALHLRRNPTVQALPGAQTVTPQALWERLGEGLRETMTQDVVTAMDRSTLQVGRPEGAALRELEEFYAWNVLEISQRTREGARMEVIPIPAGGAIFAVGTDIQMRRMVELLKHPNANPRNVLRSNEIRHLKLGGQETTASTTARRPSAGGSSTEFETHVESKVKGKKADRRGSNELEPKFSRQSSSSSSTETQTELVWSDHFTGHYESLGVGSRERKKVDMVLKDLKSGRSTGHRVGMYMAYDIPGFGQSGRGAYRLLTTLESGKTMLHGIGDYHNKRRIAWLGH